MRIIKPLYNFTIGFINAFWGMNYAYSSCGDDGRGVHFKDAIVGISQLLSGGRYRFSVQLDKDKLGSLVTDKESLIGRWADEARAYIDEGDKSPLPCERLDDETIDDFVSYSRQQYGLESHFAITSFDELNKSCVPLDSATPNFSYLIPLSFYPDVLSGLEKENLGQPGSSHKLGLVSSGWHLDYLDEDKSCCRSFFIRLDKKNYLAHLFERYELMKSLGARSNALKVLGYTGLLTLAMFSMAYLKNLQPSLPGDSFIMGATVAGLNYVAYKSMGGYDIDV